MNYEAVFKRLIRKLIYIKGLAKTQFQGLMSALTFNLKRLTTIGAPTVIFI